MSLHDLFGCARPYIDVFERQKIAKTMKITETNQTCISFSFYSN